MILSFRYLTDDQFWFSVFHEIGHLLLHGTRSSFVEGLGLDDHKEQEADEFAARTILPTEFEGKYRDIEMNKRAIRAFADEIGVAPGLIVGRLQHEKRLRFNFCNDLKVRYRW